ncbi:ATP-binding protein [Nocardioides aequoreus]|uniref:ATP-binding protein n=1 Tax=Nocardioides aequoreus TaxID=397278 RepID=UPI0004C3A534|nr:LuxR family transcriptional regulator [Nocardioides aequoreus]
MTGQLLERERELEALLAATRAGASGAGAVVLLHGEAGIGKSTLVEELRLRVEDDVVPGRVLVGHCDDLATPRLLGPLRDLVPVVGAALAVALRGDDRDRQLAALVEELCWPGHPTVLVVEDAHWVDEATLDVLRVLVRRLEGLPAVLVLTYREVDRRHPLHRLLAAAHRGRCTDLPLAPLTAPAVAALGGDAELHRTTGGNPFFVHEVLAHGGGVPASVVESVLARLDHLSPAARAAVEQLSVLTAPATREVVDDLVAGGFDALAPAEEHGLLSVAPSRVSFRHELTRRAVVDALPAARRAACHAAALTSLDRPGADVAMLVHHAVGAGDAETVVRLGPGAARAAAAAGAHLQAAAHYRAVLEHRGLVERELGDAGLAELLQESAIEGYAVGDGDRVALDDQVEAVGLRRRLGDQQELGTALRWLSRIAWWCGDVRLAARAGSEAVTLLDRHGTTAQQALAHSNLSQLAVLGTRLAQAQTHARRAIELAREAGDPVVELHAVNNLGLARWKAGEDDGRALLEESLHSALRLDAHEHAIRAYCNLAWQCLATALLDDATAYLDEALMHAERAEHVAFARYLSVEKAMVAVARSEWDAARELAAAGRDTTLPIRCGAVTVLAQVALRTGDPAADALVDEAWSIAATLDEVQRTGPAAVVLAERALLRGDGSGRTEVTRVRDEAAGWGYLAFVEQLDWWRAAAYDEGGRDWSAEAAAMESRGYRYEAALALSLVPRADARAEALRRLDALGARPLADRVRRGLLRDGVAAVPRGPRPETRAHPAGLTPRQVEVLSLLAEGCTNADIAARLVLSVRTVDHHVTAVLHKCGATTRREAVALAREQGWVAATARDG